MSTMVKKFANWLAGPMCICGGNTSRGHRRANNLYPLPNEQSQYGRSLTTASTQTRCLTKRRNGTRRYWYHSLATGATGRNARVGVVAGRGGSAPPGCIPAPTGARSRAPPCSHSSTERLAGAVRSAFSGQRSLRHDVCRSSSGDDAIELRLHSWNPDLRIVQTKPANGANGRDTLPLRLTGGSPFFEVASYRGRWFLRDGWLHRAFAMLRAGVNVGFAVVVAARTLEELGAVGPWFFGEDTLFSNRPPMVTDFLEDACVLQYDRPRLRKTITVRIEEFLEPHQNLHTKRTPQ